MADVLEPEYDDQEAIAPAADAEASSSNPLAASSASVTSTTSAAEALKQQVEAQLQGHSDAVKPLTEDEKKELDARSVHVSGVDYSVVPADLQHLFEKCGEIVRVKIMVDKMQRPKGFAYIEFAHIDSVARALELTDTVLKSRAISVTQKRTNVPGMKRGGGAPAGPHRGGFVQYVPVPFGYGMPQRGRGGPFRGGHANQVRGRGRTHPYER